MLEQDDMNAKLPVSPQKSDGKENETDAIAQVTQRTRKSPRKSSTNEIARVESNESMTPTKERTVSSSRDVAVEINFTSNQNIQVGKLTRSIRKCFQYFHR